MTAALLAANKLRADTHAVTGDLFRPSINAATSPTEIAQSLFHGESGNLGYLFDNAADMFSALPAGKDPVGPHGGASHPDQVGHQVNTALPPNASNVRVPVVVGQAQEGAEGIFG